MSKPFMHNEIEVKKKFLEIAKTYMNNAGDKDHGLANLLAGSLLYANIADYLAMHLYESLQGSLIKATRRYYLGDLIYKPKKKKGFDYTLGSLIYSIDEFEFENKEEIIQALKEVNEARIPVIHHIAKTPSKDLEKIDLATLKLRDSTEKLIDLIDDLYVNHTPLPELYNIKSGIVENNKKI